MAKNKKKAKKPAPQQIHDLTRAQLTQAAEASLRNGAPKAAVDMLRFAVKKHGLTPELKQRLFQALLSHAGQLQRQGQAPEAEAAAEQAGLMAEDVSWLAEADLLAFVSLCSGTGAFDTYSRYVRYRRRVPEAESLLAGHLFRHRQWALADRLDSAVPLAREADIVREAVALMDEGAWEDALEGLRPLPRKSSFAPVRLLCRAMTSFYAGDDTDAVKALSMIPDHFPLSGVTARLRDALSSTGGPETRMDAAASLPELWEGSLLRKVDLQDLIHSLDRGNIGESAKAVGRMAQSACPENPAPLRALLLQAAGGAVFAQKIPPNAYLRMASTLLPEPRAESLHLRMMMTLEASPADAGRYLTRHLAADFPDAAERNIAHANVLLHIVRQRHKLGWWEGTPLDEIPARCMDVLGLGHRPSADIPIEMAVKALVLDPENRDGYLLLGELPRRSREDRKKVESAFLAMMEGFPDDPFPCLTLASVYYENHAFRKAESVLREAMRRAPHDTRVVDRHAVSLLIAAEKNIRRGKFHLASPDIERAGMLPSKGAAPYVTAKRTQVTLMDPRAPRAVLETGGPQMRLFDDVFDFVAFLDGELKALPLVDRLRMLSFLIPDLEYQDFSQKKPILKFLIRRLKENLGQAKKLPSADIARLLSPLGKDYAEVFSVLNPAPLLLKQDKNLLGAITDEEITATYDLIMARETLTPIIKDIRVRLKRAGAREKVILNFYLAAVRHMSGEVYSYDLFHEVLDEARELPLREALRAIARRLSRHATGNLRQALAHFYFGPKPGEHPFLPLADEDDDDFFSFLDDDDDDDEFLDPGSHPPLDPASLSGFLENIALDPEPVVDMFERLIDSLDLRGEPDRIIRMVRSEFLQAPGIKGFFDQLARRLDPSLKAVSGMSREARLFIYGTSPGKTPRKRR
ncbi:tetratricopeptide repeat protein [Desulfococcus sp.]|uniref:tetratricopeptide repeat protein n=1 Tax=Desulfococcus sp. TaxID=2025834 RepID=UPI0035947D7F